MGDFRIVDSIDPDDVWIQPIMYPHRDDMAMVRVYKLSKDLRWPSPNTVYCSNEDIVPIVMWREIPIDDQI